MPPNPSPSQPKRILTTASSPRTTTTPTQAPKWYSALTLDLVLSVLRRTILHPWPAWILVLSLRAQVTPTTDLAFVLATGYAVLVTVVAMAGVVNARVAYGLPRTVELGEEVVVITGGASGLGLLIAEIYAMRGVGVAVLDLKDERDVEVCEGVVYYTCDVGRREMLEGVLKRIEEEVCFPLSSLLFGFVYLVYVWSRGWKRLLGGFFLVFVPIYKMLILPIVGYPYSPD